MRVRVPLSGTVERPGREAWPFLLLLFAVLVPTGLLLWFMSDAFSRESKAAAQAGLEAYRSQLRLLRTRAEELSQVSSSQLELGAASQRTNRSPATHFLHLVREQHLDGALLFDEAGRALFPQLVSQERSAAADELLLAKRIDPLVALLNDYTTAIPSGQRLFLMGELRRLLPGVILPTENALRLSTRLLERDMGGWEPGGFHPTGVDDVWSLTSADRRVVGFYRTATLHALLDQTLAPLATRNIRFLAYPPEAKGDGEAISAGPALPGWQLSFAMLNNPTMAPAARTRFLTYLWAGFAGTGILVVVGIVAGQTIRRQLRLARLKTDLTAAVSHELRAPLAAVRVLVDGLLEDDPLDPIKTREYLQLIAGEHARLTRVIENFLSFARLERGGERLSLVPVHPSHIVTSSISAIKDRTPPGCDLRTEVSADLPQIMADSDALETALVNLLDNAIKFTADDKQILVRAYAEGGQVVLTVRDNGPGIAASERRRIFKRFYRVDRRLARETSGVGLGLSIVALIVRAHKGQIEVASEPEAGSTFALRFPALVNRSS